MDSLSVLRGCFLGIIIIVLYRIYRFICKIRHLYKIFKDTPGPTDFHWFYGSGHLLKDKTADERLKFFEDLNLQFPRYFVMWFGPFDPQIFLNHSDTVKTIFKTLEPKYLSPGGAYQGLQPWIGDGLLVSNGNRWARSRRLLTPAFHFDILKAYINIYNDSAETLMDVVSEYSENGESFELFQVISNCTLDVILKCACSYETGCQQSGKTHPYVNAVTELARIVDARTRNIFLANYLIFHLSPQGRRFRKYCKYVHDVAEEIIRERRKFLEEKGLPARKYLDFLDILLTAKDHDGMGLTNQEIRNEVDTFLFEGHDTTASGISWILYHLARNPEHLKKCQKEIDSVLRSKPRIEWNCIGQVFALNEEKVILARFLHRFDIELDKEHKLIKEVALIFRSANGIKVRIKQRNPEK